jgi:hypothetical protein
MNRARFLQRVLYLGGHFAVEGVEHVGAIEGDRQHAFV